jgi:hypothetical protein
LDLILNKSFGNMICTSLVELIVTYISGKELKTNHTTDPHSRFEKAQH